MPATGRGLIQLFGPDSTPQRLIPLGIARDDVVFASNLTSTDGGMHGALELMRAVVEEAGGSIDNIARVSAYVPRAADREAVYGPWDALFPDPADRPAFKVLVAALPDGVAVRLDMLALLGGRRRRIDLPGVSARDPTVHIGHWTLTSRVHGTDPATGTVAVGGIPAEARQALTNVEQLTSGREIQQLLAFVRDASITVDVPATNVLTNFVPPSMNLMLEAIAGTPAVREIRVGNSVVPDAIMIEDLLFAPALGPTSVEGDFASQFESALQHMQQVLAAANLDRDAVAQVTVYFPDAELRPALNDVWARWFPDAADRPPHKYVPVELPPRQLVQLQVFAVREAPRQVLEIPGVVHGDPMSMGVRMGPFLFSSRVFGPNSEAVCSNVRTLLAQAGSAHITQLLAFTPQGQEDMSIVEDLRTFSDGSGMRVRFLHPNIPGLATVRLEVLAAVQDGEY
jgi:enamine deaminase RidA (YjgF/YER057c/UK114 family)